MVYVKIVGIQSEHIESLRELGITHTHTPQTIYQLMGGITESFIINSVKKKLFVACDHSPCSLSVRFTPSAIN